MNFYDYAHYVCHWWLFGFIGLLIWLVIFGLVLLGLWFGFSCLGFGVCYLVYFFVFACLVCVFSCSFSVLFVYLTCGMCLNCCLLGRIVCLCCLLICGLFR